MACCDNCQLYLFNWAVFLSIYYGQMACFGIAGWGLFFDDDDGVFMNKCYENYGGFMAEFPYYYLSQVSVEHPDQ